MENSKNFLHKEKQVDSKKFRERFDELWGDDPQKELFWESALQLIEAGEIKDMKDFDNYFSTANSENYEK